MKCTNPICANQFRFESAGKLVAIYPSRTTFVCDPTLEHTRQIEITASFTIGCAMTAA